MRSARDRRGGHTAGEQVSLRRAVVLADPVERRTHGRRLGAHDALAGRFPVGRAGHEPRQDHVDRGRALRVVGDDLVVVDAEQREHHRRDEPGAVLPGRALEHERKVRVDRDQLEHRHELRRGGLEDRAVALGEGGVDEIRCQEGRDRGIDQRHVLDANAGSAEPVHRRGFHFVLPTQVDDRADTVRSHQVLDLGRLAMCERVASEDPTGPHVAPARYVPAEIAEVHVSREGNRIGHERGGRRRGIG